MVMKFYKLIGAGELQRVSETEYDNILVHSVHPSYYEDLKKDKTGVNFLGAAYIALSE